jgi:hypothetical protein
MRVFFLIMVSAVVLSAADPQATKKAAAPAAAKTIKPLEIPAGAVESEPGTFKYTDPQGKKWIYRKTPWGTARLEDKPASEADRAAQRDRFANVTANEDGDTVRFERPGPFGVYKWQKKKSDLDEMERAAWTRAKNDASAKRD